MPVVLLQHKKATNGVLENILQKEIALSEEWCCLSS
jgi:hypothetical protein